MNVAQRRVYLSYAWGGESERIVDALDADLQALGIVVVRDKRLIWRRWLSTPCRARISACTSGLVKFSEAMASAQRALYPAATAALAPLPSTMFSATKRCCLAVIGNMLALYTDIDFCSVEV